MTHKRPEFMMVHIRQLYPKRAHVSLWQQIKVLLNWFMWSNQLQH